MRVSDVVQHADLSIWAEAALVLFFAAFMVTAIRAIRVDRRETEAMAATPFDDGDGVEHERRPSGEGASR